MARDELSREKASMAGAFFVAAKKLFLYSYIVDSLSGKSIFSEYGLTSMTLDDPLRNGP